MLDTTERCKTNIFFFSSQVTLQYENIDIDIHMFLPV